MLRTGLVGLQIVLGAACGYLAWSLVAALVFAAPVSELELPPAPPASAGTEPLTEYNVIGSRNLFGSADLGPGATAPVEVEESLPDSKLQLRLIGTAATDPPEFGIAAVEDMRSRERVQLRQDDKIQGGTVVRVERRRLVIQNKGRLEQIVLDEDAPPPRARGASRAPRSAGASARRKKVDASADARKRSVAQRMKSMQAKLKGAVQKKGVAGVPMADTSLLRQAQVRPRFEGQELAGLEVRDLKEGSELADAGLEDGDVVVAVNGEDFQELARAYELLSKASGLTVLDVQRGEETISFELER